MKTKRIIALIDLTRLVEEDNETAVINFCQMASELEMPVACVCIYPQYVAAVRAAFPKLTIATVANFPGGDSALDEVASSIQSSIAAGANEIDVVMPYTQLIEGNIAYVAQFLKRCREETADKALLKVIIESGALDDKQIIKATAICANANVDFIKTSTGKIATGVSPKVVDTILKVFAKLDNPPGIKISGGVHTPEQAMAYIDIIAVYRDEAWITPQHVRIGASRLLDALNSSVAPKPS
ncbi:MAG: deoxyribose-phosphate aldolase [Coxiella sp. (in: Bacteria)]|nr:MAG: deoxyribose-phosphate aldolase [Coxiella sp. (in: g-proteobacteria)]